MVNKQVQKLESDLWDKLEEYFPKGESKERGKAIVLIALAKEMGVQGHADYIKTKDALEKEGEQ